MCEYMDDTELLEAVLTRYKTFYDVTRAYNLLQLHVKCTHCGEDIIKNAYSIEGIKEATISGLCEKCFDRICSED